MNLSITRGWMRSTIAVLSLTAAMTWSGTRSWAQNPSQPVVADTAGERLDAAMIGPGVIESMDVVIERDRIARESGQINDPKSRDGKQGAWTVPSRRATYHPHSGVHNVVNQWGDTSMGIAFGSAVDVNGAFFAGQAGRGAWTTGVRAVGYRSGSVVATTDWFEHIGDTPQFFEMNLVQVDRVVIESRPALNGGGWYGMDDLSFVRRNDDGPPGAQTVVLDFEDCQFGQKLTGSAYRGLTWETGTGDFNAAQGIPAPISDRELEPQGDSEPTGGISGGGGTTPTLAQNFQGVIRGDANQFSYPPDTCGAVGSDHFVETVNLNFSVYLKSNGSRIVNSSLSSFLPGANGDPRVLFDQHSGRWVIISTDFSTKVFLAVSTTNSAAGSWFKTSFVVSAGSDASFFPDYPTLGVDANGIYVAAALQTISIFAIDKAPLIAPAPSLGTVTAFRNLGFDGAVQPAHTYGTPSGEYFISRQSSTQLRLRRVNPPLNSPTLTTLTSATVPANSPAADVPALGSATPLDSVDARLMNAVYRDGFVWAAHTISVGGRAAVRWYKVNVANSTVAESGTIDDPVLHYFFPGIAINSLGDMAIGFSGSHANQFAGCYFTGRAFSDSPGQTGTVALLRAGTAAHNLIDNFGRNRWGDYSLTSLDPADDLTLWTVQEYVHGTNTWGTQIGKLVISAAPINNICINATTVGDGSFPFTTVNASTDGPAEPAGCGFGGPGGTQVANDVWFKLLATCAGTYTVSLCGSNYDSRLAVYSICPDAGVPGQFIACNDDFCGSSSQLTFHNAGPSLYRIRIGGAGAAMGAGTVVISCEPDAPTCLTDIAPAQGDGEVNIDDLLLVINSWGFTGPPGTLEADIAPDGGDGEVNIDDLLAIVNTWGACP